jgi:hypothetical protein
MSHFVARENPIMEKSNNDPRFHRNYSNDCLYANWFVTFLILYWSSTPVLAQCFAHMT